MSVFIDRSFLLQVSPKLQRFAKKKDDLYNFRCPLCGDSQKNKLKSRGYVYRKKNDYFYMCHNCGVSTTFYNFLKQVDDTLLKEYQLERYKNGETGNNNYPKPDFDEYKQEAPKFKKALELPSIESLPEAHFAKNYVHQRRIPETFYSQLYFAEDLINEEELIYVLEGPIDSMFLENAVATADSNLESITDVLDKSKVVLVFDNEPRNKEIVFKMEHAIDNHFNVVIWPEMIEEKDINDMVLSGFSPDEIQDIISKNTFVNLRAKMEFVSWKKT